MVDSLSLSLIADMVKRYGGLAQVNALTTIRKALVEGQKRTTNSGHAAIALRRYREYLRLDNRRKTDVAFIVWCEQQQQ